MKTILTNYVNYPTTMLTIMTNYHTCLTMLIILTNLVNYPDKLP